MAFSRGVSNRLIGHDAQQAVCRPRSADVAATGLDLSCTAGPWARCPMGPTTDVTGDREPWGSRGAAELLLRMRVQLGFWMPTMAPCPQPATSPSRGHGACDAASRSPRTTLRRKDFDERCDCHS